MSPTPTFQYQGSQYSHSGIHLVLGKQPHRYSGSRGAGAFKLLQPRRARLTQESGPCHLSSTEVAESGAPCPHSCAFPAPHHTHPLLKAPAEVLCPARYHRACPSLTLARLASQQPHSRFPTQQHWTLAFPEQPPLQPQPPRCPLKDLG